MKTSQHFLLGLLFIVALSVLGYFTFFLSDFTIFGEQQTLTVHFPEAGGLRKGDSVLVAGVRYGKVSDLTYDPKTVELDRRITVVLTMEKEVELRADHQILIEDATLLGGKNLTIDPGSAESPLVAPDAVLLGEVEPNVIRAAGELVTDNADAVTEAISTIRDLVRGVEEGRGTMGKIFSDDAFAAEVDRAVTGAADSAENLKTISDRLVAGEGTLGKLLASDEIYGEVKDIARSLETLLAEANATIEDLRSGKGLLGAVITDEELSQNVKDGVRNIKEIVERANRGEGTLGKILVDDGIAVSIDTVFRRLKEGEGTLGKLFAEEEIYEDLRVVSSDLRDIIATVRDGRGTLGKLLMEEGMYTELIKAVGLLTRSLEEYREAAPISTMTSVIFGAF